MGTSITLPQGSQIIVNQIEAEDGAAANEKEQDEQNYQDDGKGNHDLPDELKAALKNLLTHYGGVVDKASRRQEVIAARRGRFYWRLMQYIYFNNAQSVFLPIIAGQVVTVGDRDITMPRYTAVHDIYRSYGRNYTAILSQNPPGVNFQPVEPGNSTHIKMAELAEQYSEHYDQVNQTRAMQRKISRLFWTDGRVVGRTFHRVSKEEYGTDDQGNARGEEVTHLYGVLEAKVFPMVADDRAGLTGVIISDDPDINKAKSEYSWIKDNIRPGASGYGESAFERNARLGVLEGRKTSSASNEAYSHLTERQMMYLRPFGFEHNKQTADQLKKIFPLGVRATFVSGEYAEAWPCSVDDEIDVRQAMDGDGMNRPAWGAAIIPLQDAVNNYENMTREYHDYGIPETYYDKALFDGQSRREKGAQPGEYTGVVNPAQGSALEQYFYTTTPAQAPGDLIAAKQDLRDAQAQLVSAVQPALFGGNLAAGKDADRVGVYQMAREQAMGVISLPWGAMQSAFAVYKYQAVIAAGKNRNENDVISIERKVKGRGNPKPVAISVADLKNKGKFRAVPDTDSSFPATRQMKSQAFEKLAGAAEFNPAIAEAINHPDNMEMGLELEGLSADVDIPAARAWRRQMDEIDQLLATGPIPPTRTMVEAARMKAAATLAVASSAQMKPAPPLPPELAEPSEKEWADPKFMQSDQWMAYPLLKGLAKCSIQPHRFDYHQYHIQAIEDWFNTDAFTKAMQTPEGRLGVFNIELHHDLHEKMLAAKMAAMPQPVAPQPPAKHKPPQAAPQPQPPNQGAQANVV